MYHPIKFDTTDEEDRTILKVVARGLRESNHLDNRNGKLTMDLMATHSNGCPLDLDALLQAPRFDFLHDLHGIQAHIDRSTGRLDDAFLPRCAAATA